MTSTHIVALALVAAMTVTAPFPRQELSWSELTERLERAALAELDKSSGPFGLISSDN